MAGHPQQHPGRARTRSVDGPNADRCRRGQRSDSLPVAMASPGAGDVVSHRGRRRRARSPAGPGEATRRHHRRVRRSAVHPTDRTSGWAWLPYRSAPAVRWSRFGVYCGSGTTRRMWPSVRRPRGWRDSACHTSGRWRSVPWQGARDGTPAVARGERSRAVGGGAAGRQHRHCTRMGADGARSVSPPTPRTTRDSRDTLRDIPGLRMQLQGRRENSWPYIRAP